MFKFQPYNKHQVFRLFNPLYNYIPHDKLKSRLASTIWNSFIFKNGNRRYKYLVLDHEEPYFVIKKETCSKMYTPFKSDLINDMDHAHFRVLNPRQWSLAKESSIKSWKCMPKNAKTR